MYWIIFSSSSIFFSMQLSVMKKAFGNPQMFSVPSLLPSWRNIVLRSFSAPNFNWSKESLQAFWIPCPFLNKMSGFKRFFRLRLKPCPYISRLNELHSYLTVNSSLHSPSPHVGNQSWQSLHRTFLKYFHRCFQKVLSSPHWNLSFHWFLMLSNWSPCSMWNHKLSIGRRSILPRRNLFAITIYSNIRWVSILLLIFRSFYCFFHSALPNLECALICIGYEHNFVSTLL